MPMPTALSEYEKETWPWRRTISLSTITAMPLMSPSAIRPLSLIKRLSKAYLMKYATPIRIAATPMRFNHSLPIWPSRSSLDFAGCFAPIVEAKPGALGGGGGGMIGRDGGTADCVG